ncbi:MAG: SAM-dependent methyltransferase [Aerococcus viridans]|nr:MAG: SAM-dependent methyltransferase [Aerococcus viridans]
MNQVTLLDGERFDALIPQALEIIQSDLTFSFSVDAILLAHFAQVSSSRIKKTNAHIHGIEIQPQVADMAARSVTHNGLNEQITIHNMDLKAVNTVFAKDSMDIVTCNPPYFKRYEESKVNLLDAKTLARHEVAMTAEDIFQQAQFVLRNRSKLYIVHRPERLSELIFLGNKSRLTLKKLQFIYPKPGKEAKTILLEFMKDGRDKGLRVLPPFYTQTAEDTYTPEMRRLIYGD